MPGTRLCASLRSRTDRRYRRQLLARSRREPEPAWNWRGLPRAPRRTERGPTRPIRERRRSAQAGCTMHVCSSNDPPPEMRDRIGWREHPDTESIELLVRPEEVVITTDEEIGSCVHQPLKVLRVPTMSLAQFYGRGEQNLGQRRFIRHASRQHGALTNTEGAPTKRPERWLRSDRVAFGDPFRSLQLLQEHR